MSSKYLIFKASDLIPQFGSYIESFGGALEKMVAKEEHTHMAVCIRFYIRASPTTASGPASRFPALAGPLAEPLEAASGKTAKKSASPRLFTGAGRFASRSAGRHCRRSIG